MSLLCIQVQESLIAEFKYYNNRMERWTKYILFCPPFNYVMTMGVALLNKVVVRNCSQAAI